MSPEPITSHPQVIAVPSDRAWLDPRLLLNIFETVFTDVFIPNNNVTLLAPPDPRRAVLGITFPNAVAPGASFGPWTDPDKFVSGLISSSTTAFYTLREHYTLPTLGWYVSGSQNMTYRIMEIRRR